MVLQHYYDGTLLVNAVQLAEEHSFSASAATGDADIVGIVVDDPAGTLTFVGDRRWTMIEDACPAGNQVVWRGWTGKQAIGAREGDTIYPDGVGRRWNLDLIEDNTCLGFRIFAGSGDNRPAETVTRRLTWLLTTPGFTGAIVDHGLVASSTVMLDGHDFRGQTGLDVLADLAIASGFNFYARYREDSDDLEIAFYDADTSALDTSTLRISNDPADIDYITTWPAAPTLRVERDPSRLARGIYLPSAKGAVYVGGGPGLRDMTAPSATVKTAAKATTLANRLLAQHNEQDEKLTSVRVQLDAANLNDVRHGQRIEVRQTHLPGWTAFRGARVVSKSFSRPSNLTQAKYDVDLELSRAPIFACSYVAPVFPGTSSLDVLGGSISDSGGYNPASPVYPSTVTGDVGGAQYFYGTPNSGATFGVAAQAWPGGTYNWHARWTWDLLAAGSPRICRVGVYEWGVMSPYLTVEGSHDGSDWTTVLTNAQLQAAAENAIPIGNSAYRYWSLHWVHPTFNGGYFGGLDMIAVLLWGGSLT